MYIIFLIFPFKSIWVCTKWQSLPYLKCFDIQSNWIFCCLLVYFFLARLDKSQKNYYLYQILLYGNCVPTVYFLVWSLSVLTWKILNYIKWQDILLFHTCTSSLSFMWKIWKFQSTQEIAQLYNQKLETNPELVD